MDEPQQQHAMGDDLDAIQRRLAVLRERLDAFEPWDHAASTARLNAIDDEAQQRRTDRLSLD